MGVGTGAMVMTTLTKPLDSVVPLGVTNGSLTVSLELTRARSIGWVFTEVRAVSTEEGPETVTVAGLTTIPVIMYPDCGSPFPEKVGVTGRIRSVFSEVITTPTLTADGFTVSSEASPSVFVSLTVRGIGSEVR